MSTSLQNSARAVYYLTEAEAQELPSLSVHAKIEDHERRWRSVVEGSRQLTCLIESCLGKLDDVPAAQRIDESGEIDEFLRTCEQILTSRSVPWFEAFLANREKFAGTSSEYWVAIHDYCEQALDHVHDQLRLLQALRWKVNEHDADLEDPLPERFSSIEDLLAKLKA